MASKKQVDQFPPLHRPNAGTADSGKVRLGDGIISDDFPTLVSAPKKTADAGKVRLGDGIISDDFPV
jgi:hypothetical protein